MHELPKLPYAYDALEPHIDAKTMEIHHTKHHQAYINKLDTAVKGTEFESMDADEIVKNLSKIPENIRNAVRNNGGGHANHSFFWQVIAPKAGGKPSGAVADAINSTFGSFDKFKEQFTNAGMTRFGSGWAWLVVDNGKLAVTSTPNQDNPLTEGKTPILGLDVWEHGYYLLYKNKRDEYIKNWWNVVNWDKVEENYNQALN